MVLRTSELNIKSAVDADGCQWKTEFVVNAVTRKELNMIEFLIAHWWQILLTGVLTAVSGICYRFGGSNNGVRWVRQVVDGLCVLACLTIWFGWNWFGLLIMGTIWITSTYFKIKGNTNFFTWMLVGFSFGLVPLPYMLMGHAHWLGFFIRFALLGPLVGIVVRFFGGNVNFSEGFRGGIQIITLPLLLL